MINREKLAKIIAGVISEYKWESISRHEIEEYLKTADAIIANEQDILEAKKEGE